MNIGVAHPNGIAIRGAPIEAADVVVTVVLKVAHIDEVSDVEGTASGGKVRRWDQRQDFGGYRINATGGNLVSRKGIFFFQAEDGIRDLTVTGVQTCALPI